MGVGIRTQAIGERIGLSSVHILGKWASVAKSRQGQWMENY